MNNKGTFYGIVGTFAIVVVVLAIFGMGGADAMNKKFEPLVDQLKPWLGYPEVGVIEGRPTASNAEHGDAIDSMIIYVHILMAVLFVGWTAYFAIAVWKFRKSRNAEADHAGVTSKVPTTLAEYGVIAAEVVLIAVFAVPLWGEVVNVDEFPSEGMETAEFQGEWASSVSGMSVTGAIDLSGNKLKALDDKAAEDSNSPLEFKNSVTLPEKEDSPETALYVVTLKSEERTVLEISWGEEEGQQAVVDNAPLLDGLQKSIHEKEAEIRTIKNDKLDFAEDDEKEKLERQLSDLEGEIKKLKTEITGEKLVYSQMVEIKSGAKCELRLLRGGNISTALPGIGGNTPKTDDDIYKDYAQDIREQLANDTASVDDHRQLSLSINIMPTVVVRVVAEQFDWNGIYAGYDGSFGKQDVSRSASDNKFGFVREDANGQDDFVANEVVVAAGVPVITHISSLDVIHCFKVFPMRICQDAIPGLKIPIHFKPLKPLKSWVHCAQLCGNGHAYMRGDFEVKSRADFATWWNARSGWWNTAQ